MGSNEGVGSSETSTKMPTASKPDAREVSAVDAAAAPSNWNVITLLSSSSASGVSVRRPVRGPLGAWIAFHDSRKHGKEANKGVT